MMRDLVHELLDQADRRPYAHGHCCYCGRRCYGRVCDQHRDLPQLEHALMNLDPAALLEEQATGSTTTGG